jgi:hypothetical protein
MWAGYWKDVTKYEIAFKMPGLIGGWCQLARYEKVRAVGVDTDADIPGSHESHGGLCLLKGELT